MKKFILAALLVPALQIKAQDYLGFETSNYSGITAAQLNPASIVDGRMKFDATLIGFSFRAYNNFVGMKRSALNHNGSLSKAIHAENDKDSSTVGFPAFHDNNFQKNYLTQINNGKIKNVFMSTRVTLPSFMFNIGRKNAVGIAINFRTIANIDGVGQDLANLVYSDIGRNQNVFDVSNLMKLKLNNEHLSAGVHSWMDYGVTYARVLRDKDEHYFKIGITPKLLQGIASAYVDIKNLAFSFNDNKNSNPLSVLSVSNTEVSYAHSSNLEFPTTGSITNPIVDDKTFYYTMGMQAVTDPQTGGTSYKFSGYPKQASWGFGLDAGFIYEWRPNYKDFQYEMDGKTGLWRKDKSKYKLKVGASVVDIGGIRYKKGKYSSDFVLNSDSIKYRLFKLKDYPVTKLDQVIDSLATVKQTSNTYKMTLPTVISMQIDYNIYKDFYLNCTPYIALQFKNRQAKVHDITSISLSPRWDHRWFGISVPVAYNVAYAKANQPIIVGSMVRIGPLVIGSNNIGNYLGKKDIFGADMYFLLKIPILQHPPRDRDKDKVSDKMDDCKTIPGVWEFHGCPDRDGDHIKDSEDKCPDVPGLKELQGCPDKDGDGITDAEDDCPDDKGLQEFKGCPDRDGDKIIDKEDECPDDPGLKEFMGCPDKDGDGTPDKFDACPDVFGPKEYKGCPDRDGDGVLDKEDACVDIPGPKENKGCPWPDTDKDGILDKDDACPTTAGVAEYKGCPPPPPVKPAELKIIEKAFQSLEFATAKDIIKPKSYPSLNDLAKLLVNHKGDWKLKLSGHTDNDGTPEKNMILSEKRAKAVKAYLAKKGVPADNILTEWFGQTQPIADNTTPAGKQKNRRVEMKIIFKEQAPAGGGK